MSLIPVDGLEVRVLIDNVTDSLSSTPPGVETEFTHVARRGLRPASGRNLSCAVHGLSLMLNARRGPIAHTLLFDTGPEEFALERNATRLGAPLTSVEGIVLSHGHWDHCGGVLGALNLAQKEPGRLLPVYVHPEMFRTRARPLPNGALSVMDDVPSVKTLQVNGAEVISIREPQTLLDGMFYLSGEVPRVTDFEPGVPGQVRSTDDGNWERDELMPDERWLAVNVADKGLVVVSGCSHAGIINVLKHAQATFAGIPIHAIVGGLHLSGPSEAYIEPTVKSLRHFNLKSIAAAHCTGWRAVGAMANAFGDGVVAPSAVGKRYNY